MRIHPLSVLCFAILALFVRVAHAEPLDPKAVPEPLKPWTAWALRGQDGALCPSLQGTQQTPCAWPARLDLVLEEKRGTFKQSWHLDAKRAVPLPGDDKRWPLDVTVDGKRSVVLPRDGIPHVELEPGDHVVGGTFAWDSLPESLRIPPETALLGLVLRGKNVDLPNRDAKGTLWLQKQLGAQEEGERLDFVVHRKVVDEVPVQLTTRIVLNVAGRNREVLLGKMLPQGFVPMALESQLPARVEPDARLRVQARPGTWTIEVVARSEGPVSELRRPKPEGPWREGEEVWVFDARTNLRLVDVQGVSAIDPQQTSLPEEWKRLPTYPLGLNDTMRLVEKRRGDAEPPPDHLVLARTLWLDFDGKGFTATDTLSGNLRRASRLEMLPPTVLGRVAIAGKDQFITHLASDAARTGVEVRQGDLSVTADSRIQANPLDVPAVGWNHDFHAVSATLHLPPGFRLLHASGVDDVPSTWVKHWTLLELFLLLVLALGIGRLHGIAWGALALVTFALTFPESGAPKYVLIFVLSAEAVVRALARAIVKAGPLPSRGLVVARRLAGWVRGVAALSLVLVAVPFLVGDVRHGLFPALQADELGGVADMAGAEGSYNAKDTLGGEPAAPPPPAAAAAAQDVDRAPAPADEAKKRAVTKSAPTGASSAWASGSVDDAFGYRQFNANVYDPTSMVQTGPGRPRWVFTQVPLRWSGPVERSQHLHLYLLSPTESAALALVRAILVITLVLRLLPFRPHRRRGEGGKSYLTFAAAAVALWLLPGVAHAQAVPSKEVLEELAARLGEKPACSPNCASSSRLLIETHPNLLRLRMEVEASALAAVPLPTSAQWAPESVLVDGKPAKSLLRTEDDKLWVAVERGWHQVIVSGPLPDRELVQLALPMKPHRVETQAEGWRVDGIHEDGLSDDNLQLTRIRSKAESGSGLEPGVLPPFVRVERTLQIGLDWQVETKVVRLSPVGTAIVLEVPLLKGESVTTADVRVAAGKAQLNFPPQAKEMSWKSVLDQRSPIVLTAPSASAWTELWRLDMSPIWHAEFAGIPVVHADAKSKLPEWRPWPGESATLAVSRPEGIAGSTLTIDASTYELRPGLRATDATLTLSMRSSRGAQHTLVLPEGAQLESVTIGDAPAAIRQDGRKVVLPIAPGPQSVKLAWRMPMALSMYFRAPPVDLGAPSVNATTTITMPDGRFPIALRGPRLGPVVLYWSLLLVVTAVACVVGAMRRTPLRTWQWVLLAVGLSQVNVIAAAVVVGWLHLLAWRERTDLSEHFFNIRQLLVVFATFVAAIVLLVAVHQGLLGQPEMQVRGNQSSAAMLRWFSDRSGPVLEGPLVVSAPMFAYRLLMLAWALWLALSLLQWLRWGFAAFGTGGFWKRPPPRPAPVMPPHRTPAPMPPPEGMPPPGA